MKPNDTNADDDWTRSGVLLARRLQEAALSNTGSRADAATALLNAAACLIAEDFGLDAAAAILGQCLDDGAAEMRRRAMN